MYILCMECVHARRADLPTQHTAHTLCMSSYACDIHVTYMLHAGNIHILQPYQNIYLITFTHHPHRHHPTTHTQNTPSQALGVRLGPVLHISESAEAPTHLMPQMAAAKMPGAPEAFAATPVNMGDGAVQASVWVTFAVEGGES